MEESVDYYFGRQLADDLWLRRRLQLPEVVEQLERRAGSSAADAPEANDWIRFVRFLETNCTGTEFSDDRQWSQLLNLMQISRRFNHKSVKFRELLKNRSIIELNAGQIRLLNQTVLFAKNVQRLCAELDSLFRLGSIELPACEALPTQAERPEPVFVAGQLLEAQSYLEQRCKPILFALKHELANERLVREASSLKFPRLEWQQALDGHTRCIESIRFFLASLIEAQKSIARLKSLLDADDTLASGSQDGQVSHQLAQSAVGKSVHECKRQFDQVCRFNNQLLGRLKLEDKKQTGRLTFPKLIALIQPECCGEPSKSHSEALASALQQLADCQSELDKTMEKLRLEFGRFCFISDQELLTVITLDTRLVLAAQASTSSGLSAKARSIVSKVFHATIESFKLDHSGRFITAVRNPFGELVAFSKQPVELRKRINVYSIELVRVFNEILRRLQATLRERLHGYLLETSGTDTAAFEAPQECPVQVVYLAEQIKFSRAVEKALDSGREESLLELAQLYEERLAWLKGKRETLSGGWLDDYRHSALSSLAVQCITTLNRLLASRTRSSSDWSWRKQTRYYWLTGDQAASGGQLRVEIGRAVFHYRFHYLAFPVSNASGASGARLTFKRLISTKTSERTLLAASAAVTLFRMGANPFGPAGSGKTETVKALGYLVGSPVIVHNCDEDNDAGSLHRLISGLAQTGLWGCLDEFNRLDAGTLSAVSASLELVQAALKATRCALELPGSEFMRVDPGSAFFVTMNPDGHRYGGRRRLPANLRHLFLPMAMVRVEADAIFGQLLLELCSRPAACHIQEAYELGAQLCRWLQRLAGLLGGIHRCEWDLRLVMAVLKRLMLLVSRESAHNRTDWRQHLADALQMELCCRLTRPEAAKVEQELGVRLAVDEPAVARRSGTYARTKANQLERQLETRGGVMLLGRAGSGKSSTWRSLLATRSSSVQAIVLNPRGCSNLFGTVTGKSWSDGLFTAQVRKAQEILETRAPINQVWIVLDGPLDPDWVESLNSVLDDNQLLTLSSGERLHFSVGRNKCIKLIFEVSSIVHASPATVSRLGLVLLEQQPGFDRRKQSTKLRIVSGSNARERADFIGNPTESNTSSKADYNCSCSSTCEELLSFLMENSTFEECRINNVHLIQMDHPKWSTSSFIELLRYTVTYASYYDRDFESRRADGRFIITTSNTAQLDPRLLEAASDIHELGPEKDETVQPIVDSSLDGLISLIVNSRPSNIITLSTSLECATGRRQALVDSFQKDGWQIGSFRRSGTAKSSLDLLVARLNEPFQSERILFLLTEMECDFMEEAFKRKLFHALNSFHLVRNAKFVYLCRNLPSKKDSCTFWQSLGCVHHQGSSASDASAQLMDSFRFELASGLSAVVQDASERSYIVEQAGLYVQPLTAATRNEEPDKPDNPQDQNWQCCYAFSNSIVSLISSTKRSLESRKRSYKMGLTRLNQFEEIVKGMRQQFVEEEQQILAKRDEITCIMATIDGSINASRLKMAEMEELKQEKQRKDKELELRSRKVELELGQVNRLVESSKKEIAKNLKPEALSEIKTMREPPKTIKDILDVLFVLLGVKDSSWSSITSFLARGNLLEELANYDIRTRLSSSSLLTKVESLIEARKSSFSAQQAARASKAIVPILSWILATVEYAKVLLKLMPLRQEMEELNAEYKLLNEQGAKVEVELENLNKEVGAQTQRLSKLEAELATLKSKSQSIAKQLQEAEETRLGLGDQSGRWAQKLDRLNDLLNSRNMNRVCLVASILATLVSSDQLLSSQDAVSLEKLCNFLDINTVSLHSLLAKVLETVLHETNMEGVDIIAEDCTKVLQLISIKFLLAGTQLVPFLAVDSGQELDESSLRSYLSFKGILCQPDDVILIKPGVNQTNGWLELSALNPRSSVILVIEMSKNNSINLDIVDRILSSKCAGNRQGSIILMGNLDEQSPHVRRLIKPIKLSWNQEATIDVNSAILDKLISFNDRELSTSIRATEQSLQLKRNEVGSLEVKLLTRLESLQEFHKESRENAECIMDQDLVEALNELQSASKHLDEDLADLTGKLQQLKAKQTSYTELCHELSWFYLHHLVPLACSDPFYRCSLENYTDMLSETFDGLESVDYSRIIELVTMAMRAADRDSFMKRLRVEQAPSSFRLKATLSSAVERFRASTNSGSSLSVKKLLAGILDKLLEPGELEERRASTKTLPLIMIHYEPSKGSPQLEVDEIVREFSFLSARTVADQSDGEARGRRRLNYRKLYGTSVALEQLEAALMRPQVTSNQAGSSQALEDVECFCLVNAHLVANWINSRLVGLLNCKTSSSAPVLVILVAEAHPMAARRSGEQGPVVSQAGGGQVFAMDTVNRAQVRYWHDESALNLVARFNLLSRLLLSAPMSSSSSSSSSMHSSIVERLAYQLILLHVVCQEGAQSRHANRLPADQTQAFAIEQGEGWWTKSYTFDYERLRLAYTSLIELVSAQEKAPEGGNAARDEQVQALLCNVLKDIIYGPLMESLEDELALERLVDHFVAAPKAPKLSATHRVKLLEAALKTGKPDEYDRLLQELLDCR